jgi:hypothetical protein
MCIQRGALQPNIGIPGEVFFTHAKNSDSSMNYVVDHRVSSAEHGVLVPRSASHVGKRLFAIFQQQPTDRGFSFNGGHSDGSEKSRSSNENIKLCENVNQSRTIHLHSVSSQNVGLITTTDPRLKLTWLDLNCMLKEDISEWLKTNEEFFEDNCIILRRKE